MEFETGTPEEPAHTTTIADLIETSLINAGKPVQAAAFRRRVAPNLAIATGHYNVRSGKRMFSSLLSGVGKKLACTVSPWAKLEHAVLMVSLEELAADLGELAVNIEKAAPIGRPPHTMFAAVDRFPALSLDEVQIDLGRKHPVPEFDLP